MVLSWICTALPVSLYNPYPAIEPLVCIICSYAEIADVYDTGFSGGSAATSMVLPEHLKKQEAKRLALLNPGGPKAGTVANAMAAAAVRHAMRCRMRVIYSLMTD